MAIRNFRFPATPATVAYLNSKVRQTIVPEDYSTSTGAKYKSRNLQYCLEDHVNQLADHDYILHLDEESLLTKAAIRGVLNFISAGRHPFGQGLITYADEDVVNWLTTSVDMHCVADDLCKMQFVFSTIHKPLYGWRGGSFMCAARVDDAEREVTFNHGPNGWSITEENLYFSMIAAYSKGGYSFDSIEGTAVWGEKSPFTITDLIRQKKRWFQGAYLTVHSAEIPWRFKMWVAISVYAVITMPLLALNLVLIISGRWCCFRTFDVICNFTSAVNMYMYFFGFIKSFPASQYGFVGVLLGLLVVVIAIPIDVMVMDVAIVWALLDQKDDFYIVDKNIKLRTYKKT